ncbi:hypothetical protein [Paenibacillus sp. FSL R7-0331]|uniref:hypothetical protein n=1 Tax=Paenibacillus sp. FSL R7-0331 TaxID=1536773 RepID=UPI0004F59719|nr:hypothetical protein [Paenibacillus sp. FSL R7-0331]AIQ54541.1 hypothetical protein R70331_25495 [Paenibacillus sp. FSL R7-0331]
MVVVMEIQVFDTCKVVESGKYQARLLIDENKIILFAGLKSWPAQIVSGTHAGTVIRHVDYIKTSDLPASSEVQMQNTRMIEQLAEAARKITACNNRTLQLEEELRVAGLSLVSQRNELEVERNGKKRVKLPKEIVEALQICATAGLKGTRLISYLPVTNQLFIDFDRIVIESLDKIRDFCFKDSNEPDLILKAMVYGYTSVPEKNGLKEYRNEVTRIIQKWWNTIPPADGKHDPERLTDQIFDYLQNEDGKLPF